MIRFAAVVALASLCACSDKDGPPDSGRDGGTVDAQSDAREVDARDTDADDPDASEVDAGDLDAEVDAGEADAEADAGEDVGIDTGIDPCITFTVGDPCTEGGEECGMDGRYDCDPDFRRCVPAGGRPICGGIVGAPCPPSGMFTQCLLNSGASGGPCLRVEEVECACPAHADFYDCPE